MNVILITLDACRFDHMSFAGYFRDTCPNLAKTAEETSSFLNNYAVIPQSEPAIISILTGTYPHTHGIQNLGKNMSANCIMLQEILKNKGYKTACMSIEQDENDALRKDFDEFNEITWRIKGRLSREIKKIFSKNKQYGAAEIVTDNAIDWIRKNKQNDFFLYMHYMELHWPYAPPSPYDHIFDPGYKGNHHFNDLNNGKIKRGDNVFNNNLPEEERKHAIAHYDGAILYMDIHLNRFIEFLKKENLWEKSIVIIVGDHGEHLGEHNIYYNHIASVYQPSLRVPLLIKIPKTNAGKMNNLTESIDIMPTVLEALNIPIENNVEGKSLMPLINAQSEKIREYAFAETGVSLFEQNKRWYFKGIEGKWKMITDGKYKLILIPHPESDIYELYNLEGDPNETRNIINEEKEIAESLKHKLSAWMQKKPIESGERPFTQKEEEKVKERLRRLGYLD